MEPSELLRDKFDLKRRHLRVVWREFAPNGTPQAYEQFIDYPRPGVTFMLGKNGAGKSTLLQGIADLAEGKVNTRCKVSLICDPAAATDEGWDEYRAELEQWFDERHESVNPSYVNFWIPSLIQEFAKRKFGPADEPRGVGGKFRGMSARNILINLGYQENEIGPEFATADPSITKLMHPDMWITYSGETPSSPAIPNDPRWILLDMMAECEFDPQVRLEIGYTHGFTDPNEWLDDPVRLSLLRDAVDEFCKSIQLEFAVTDLDHVDGDDVGRTVFRYLAQVSAGGQLEKFLRVLDEERSKFQTQTQVGEDFFVDDIWELFPYNLFTEVDSPNGPSVAGPWTRFSETLFSLVDLFPDGIDKVGLGELEHRFIEGGIKFPRSTWSDDQDKLTVEFEGFNRLSQQLQAHDEDFRKLDVGIGGLRIETEQKFVFGLEVPISVRIQWLDTRSGTWRLLEHCSDGQRRVLALFLGLLTSNQGAHPLLLADEFDRTLHPVLARQTAEMLSDLSLGMGGLGILSTHDVSLATTTPNPPWEMARHVDGSFRFVDTTHPRSRAENLGVTEADLRTMTRLVVLVEGYHDELIVNHWLPQDIQTVRSVQVIQANGIKNLRNLWDGHLRLLSCPILVVHDKRLRDLEDAVARAKELAGLPGAFEESGLRRMRDLANTEYRLAALEVKNLVDLLESAMKDGALDRVVVHGLDVEDIVDCLPFDRPFRTRGYASWEEAHEGFRENGGMNGNDFKNLHNINNDTVREVLASTDTPHPELVRLYDVIMSRAGLDPFYG